MNSFKNVLFAVIMLISSQLFSQIIFEDSGQELGNYSSEDVELIDIDNDGDLDIFIVNGNWYEEQNNNLWINNGKGGFSLSEQNFGASKSGDAEFADLNNDGYLDLFFATFDILNGAPNEVWINDGSGKLVNSGQQLGKGHGGVKLGDLDNDGDIDAFVCNHSIFDSNWENPHDGEMKIWLNDGVGNFTDSGQKLGDGSHSGVNLGDIDGDGDLDAITTINAYTIENTIWLNNGNGFFTKGQLISTESGYSPILFDLDGDTDLDLLLGQENGFEVWNNNNGVFENSEQILSNSVSNNATISDIDKDGDLDLVFSNSQYETPLENTMWLNNGQGVYTDSGIKIGKDESTKIAVGDIDNDNDPDIIIACYGKNSVWFNKSVISSKLKDHKNNSSIRIFPNPAREFININMIDLNIKSYSLLNIAGQLIQNGDLLNEKIEIAHINKGIYILQLDTKDKTIIEKVMVE